MRHPVNPIPGAGGQRIGSVAVAVTVDVWEQQPDDADVAPVGQLPNVDGRLVDDASQNVPRTLTVNIGDLPTWLEAGMWVRATVGIQTIQPIIYRLPVMCITNLAEDMSRTQGTTLTAKDPGEVLNGRPYEADVVLVGTLRQLVSDACTLALSRPTDVSGVPDVPVPVNTVAEFGVGRWDVCLSVADALGIALRFTDIGDPVGTYRSATPPSPAAVVQHCEATGGTSNFARIPTDAKVLVTRGSDTVGLIGSAHAPDITGVPIPPWYRPLVITDRVNGDANTTQAMADGLATDVLRARLSELDSFDSLPILPAPWLEAGVDVVTFYGATYSLRAIELGLPRLATNVTLRRLL
jgi:hypothetical protein